MNRPTVVDLEALQRSLTSQRPDLEQTEAIERVREAGFELGQVVLENVPAGRQRSLAITALEDVVMRAVKGVLLDGPV